jgi:SAM-dependent methyltransferase
MLRLLKRVSRHILRRLRPGPTAMDIYLETLATKDIWFYDHFVKVPQIVADFLRRAISLKSATVLDFGCGEGLMAKGLARFARSVHGIDITPTMPDVEERFRRMFGEQSPFPPVQLQGVPAGSRLPYEDGFFDAVFAWSVFEHVANVPFALREIHRVLRPGGTFLLQIYPLYFSAHGAHLWDIVNEPWIHLRLGQAELINRIECASLGSGVDHARNDTFLGRDNDAYRAGVIDCQASLNRLTIGELINHLRAAGFVFLHNQTWQDTTNEVPPELLEQYPREDLVTEQVLLLMSRRD